jgi:flagellar export protein FliJ
MPLLMAATSTRNPNHFRLQPVLSLRQRQADQLHHQWLQLLQQQQQWQQQLDQVREHISHLHHQTDLWRTQSSAQWMGYLQALRKQESLLLQQLQQHNLLLAHHKTLLVQARIKEKALEKLKTQHQQQAKHAIQATENAMLDELAQRIKSLL